MQLLKLTIWQSSVDIKLVNFYFSQIWIYDLYKWWKLSIISYSVFEKKYFYLHELIFILCFVMYFFLVSTILSNLNTKYIYGVTSSLGQFIASGSSIKYYPVFNVDEDTIVNVVYAIMQKFPNDLGSSASGLFVIDNAIRKFFI